MKNSPKSAGSSGDSRSPAYRSGHSDKNLDQADAAGGSDANSIRFDVFNHPDKSNVGNKATDSLD